MQEIVYQIQAFLERAKQPLLVILGPTASGKTAFSVDLALRLKESGPPSLPGSYGRARKGVEIINADSRQLYRHLDCGTAKITEEEMRGIPHHLLSVLDPREEVTAAWYKREATRIIDDIHRRGALPMLVGGSMLYISAIIDNLEFAGEADPELRRKLSEEYDRDQGASLMKKLEERDPESALSIDPRNKVYLIRALEICLLSEGKASRAKKKSACPYDLFILGITRPRAELHRRINERVRQMCAAGWGEEVRGLLARGYTTDDPGLKSHGYREIGETVQSTEYKVQSTKYPSLSESLMDEIASKTRQYAKRQLTWWKGDERIRWIDVDDVACRP